MLKTDSTERYNYVSKRSKKDYRLINKNLKNAWPKLQLASLGMQNRIKAQEGEELCMQRLLRPEG